MKFRRSATAVALAGALVMGGAAQAWADDYPADEPSVTTTVSSPALGQSFDVVVRVTPPLAANGEPITLTVSAPGVDAANIEIAGTQSATKPTVNSVATFTVTLNQAGTFTLTATDSAGNVLDTMTKTIAAAAGDGAANDTGVDGLPVTGSEAVLFGAGAALLVAIGATAVIGVRRKRAAA